MIGLLLVMAVADARTFEHINTFVQDLPLARQEEVKEVLEPALLRIYKNSETCRWFVATIGYLN